MYMCAHTGLASGSELVYAYIQRAVGFWYCVYLRRKQDLAEEKQIEIWEEGEKERKKRKIKSNQMERESMYLDDW